MAEDFDIESPDVTIENESLDNILGTIVSEMKEGADEAQGTEQFECPICSTMVDIDADVCPNCGAVFIEDEEQFECPVCGTLVDSDAVFCPKCGAKFVEDEEVPDKDSTPSEPAPPELKPSPEPEAIAESKHLISEPDESPTEVAEKIAVDSGKEMPKEQPAPPKEMKPLVPPVESKEREEKQPPKRPQLPVRERKRDAREKYRQLPVLVSKVKPLLIIARQNDINVKKGKELIDKAVSAGKNRQIDDAINYITESRKLLEESLTIYAHHDISEIAKDLPDLRAPEEVKERMSGVLEEIRASLQERDFDRAFQRLDIARRILKEHSGDFQEARRMVTELENTILDAEYFFMDVSRPKELLDNAKISVDAGDWATAGVFAREGLELTEAILPEM